eukprot:2237158-Pleurochrysis_carterae.AAC.1
MPAAANARGRLVRRRPPPQPLKREAATLLERAYAAVDRCGTGGRRRGASRGGRIRRGGWCAARVSETVDETRLLGAARSTRREGRRRAESLRAAGFAPVRAHRARHAYHATAHSAIHVCSGDVRSGDVRSDLRSGGGSGGGGGSGVSVFKRDAQLVGEAAEERLSQLRRRQPMHLRDLASARTHEKRSRKVVDKREMRKRR